MNLLTFSFIFISVSLSVGAQILLKHGMSSPPIQTAMNSQFSHAVVAVLTNVSILTGLFAYVSSVAIWLVVLSKIDVSKAYPFVGLGFIGTMLFAHWFLHEPITLAKVSGTMLVVAGILLISR